MSISPFPIRGVIEGFYGSFYTFPERLDMIRFLGRHDFNLYLYGPKNDRQHRARWWDPYPKEVLDEFAECIRVGEALGVAFCYAISFGVPMNYASKRDFEVVVKKFGEFYDRGCRAFGMLVDDITESFGFDSDRAIYPSVAAAHADAANRFLAWLRSMDPSCTLYLCPTQYHGRPPFGEYLHDLGRDLDPAIKIFYTGPDICSKTMNVDDVRAFGEAVSRAPVIWDNYPTNDLQMRAEMHIGPLRSRDPKLASACRGYVANLMNQAEASKIALLTIAEYLRAPDMYDPHAAWRRALMRIGGEGSVGPLIRFAENSLRSALQKEQAPHMDRLVREAMAEFRAGRPVSHSSAAEALARYFDVLDESCYHLKNRMHNLALRANLLPWIEALEEKLWMGRRALQTLQALENGAEYRSILRGMRTGLADCRRSQKRVGGEEILKLVRYVDERVREESAPPEDGTVDAATAAEVDAANSLPPKLHFDLDGGASPAPGPMTESAGTS